MMLSDLILEWVFSLGGTCFPPANDNSARGR